MLEKLVSNTSAVELDLLAQSALTHETGAVPPLPQPEDDERDREEQAEQQRDRYEAARRDADELVDFGQTLRQATLQAFVEPPPHPGQMFLPGMGFDFGLRPIPLLARPRPPAGPAQLPLPGMEPEPAAGVLEPIDSPPGRALDLEG